MTALYAKSRVKLAEGLFYAYEGKHPAPGHAQVWARHQRAADWLIDAGLVQILDPDNKEQVGMIAEALLENAPLDVLKALSNGEM